MSIIICECMLRPDSNEDDKEHTSAVDRCSRTQLKRLHPEYALAAVAFAAAMSITKTSKSSFGDAVMSCMLLH